MPQPTPSTSELEAVKTLVATTVNLIVQAEADIANITSGRENAADSNAHDKPEVNALALTADSAALLRAHGTKISLLIINEPFTPSAVAGVMRDVLSGALPGIISAAQICVAGRYTAVFRRDLAWRCGRILKELRELVQKIPLDGNILSEEQKNGTGGLRGEAGSVMITSLLWAACDDAHRLASGGVAAHLVKKVEEYRDTLKDVLEELKEWSEETADDDDYEDPDRIEDADEANGHLNGDATNNNLYTQAMVDDLMASPQIIPADDPDKIRPRLDSCLKKLRLTTILYQAIVKRRLKTLPPLPAPTLSPVCAKVDEVMATLKKLPEDFSDVAAAFYELSPDKIDEQTGQRFHDAYTVSELLETPWGGAEKDEFTDWALRFQFEVKNTAE